MADDFRFDKRVGRYRYSGGSGKGQFAPRAAILNLAQRNLDRQSEKLVGLADRLEAGKLSIQDFQRQASGLVRFIHLQSAIIASQGIDRMTIARWQLVQQEIKRQLFAGVDPQTGRQYGIKHLTNEILNGQVTIAQLRQRLAAYADNGKLSYWAIDRERQKDTGNTYAKRSISAGKNCPDCVLLAELPPRPSDQVPLPGQACRCRAGCNCTIVYMTLEQAIAAGASA